MTKKSGKERKNTKKINNDALKELISKGQKQGCLSYDEINEVLPDEMLSLDQIDETLMIFDDFDIEIVDEKAGKEEPTQKTRHRKFESGIPADFGTVTDPVKMYLREMGMVTLLSREGEVEIAKEIEAGEQEVIKALLDTTLGVESILDLGEHIENGTSDSSMY